MKFHNRTLVRMIGSLLAVITIIGFILTTANAKPSQQTDCAEYVGNGDFEEDNGWLWFPFSEIGYSEDSAASDTRSMYLNTIDNITTMAAARLPLIPEKPDSIQLRFKYRATEFNSDEAFNIVIANTAQQPLWDITFQALEKNTWLQEQFDIPIHSLVGEELVLAFALVHDDDDLHSELYIDDVSLEVCPGTLQPSPTPMPGNVSDNIPAEILSISQFMESVDLADWDGDGDLDRARGSYGRNQLYAYDKVTDSWEKVWDAPVEDNTWDVAWGDWDNDGDPDLAVANFGQANHVYRNENGTLELAWSSSEEDATLDVAWGDYDKDGDLDLAVGNAGEVNRVYDNLGGTLAFDPANGVGWQAPLESLQTEISYVIDSVKVDNLTTSIAWGDIDNDNDLDLAVGNLGFNQLYRNDEGLLVYAGTIDPIPEVTFGFPAEVNGTIPQATTSIAWGDWDGDGDLDLAAGNFTYKNREFDSTLQQLEATGLLNASGLESYGNRNLIYENVDGTLMMDRDQRKGWLFEESNETTSVAWADWENSGRLGLAVGNLGFNQIYRNSRVICKSKEDEHIYRLGQKMEQAWRSLELNISWGVLWGDIDTNGLLDLYSAELFTDRTVLKPNPGRIHFMGYGISACDPNVPSDPDHLLLDHYPKPGPFGWAEPDENIGLTNALVWGDINGDGNLDVIFGNKDTANRIYINQDGDLVEQQDLWMETPPNDMTYAVALGDLDSDGDLDLVVGNEVGQNKLYENVDGRFRERAWEVDKDDTYSVALGDWDNDSDLDVAVGNAGENLVYENDCDNENNNCVLRLDPDNGWGWRSGNDLHTRSLAWGDWDNDGDLDLAVGNLDDFNFIYENVNSTLLFDPDQNRGWQSDDALSTQSVDWGDWDGDSDLDLAVGNYADYNQVFENEHGTLHLDVANDLGWQSPEQHRTTSVDWGDQDGDNDLDLLIVNFGDVDYGYDNHGSGLALDSHNGIGWLGTSKTFASQAIWADWDNDGDLDISYAIYGNVNSVGENYTRDRGLLPDSPPVVSITTIGNEAGTPRADFQATSVLLKQQVIPVKYALADSNGNPVSAVRASFSLDRGSTWIPATHADNTQRHNLVAPSEGAQHTYNWDAEADGIIRSSSVVFRLEASQGYGGGGPYQVAYSAAQSYPFQVQAARVFARVVDIHKDAVADAILLVDGQQHLDENSRPIRTDSAGLAPLNEGDIGKSLVALLEVKEQPALRAGHDGWAYRAYLTSQKWENDTPLAATIAAEGEQRMVISSTNPLVLFNVLISIEWDATPEYMQHVADAMSISATNYLYDLTDGQMAFGEVNIYDNGNMRADADIQILARNNVRPHARIGGMYMEDGSIRLGRYWNGSSGSQGAWDQPAGYRTIVHEFAHYALNLYDEYIGYELSPNGHITGLKETNCTGLAAHNQKTDETNASAMYYHYSSSEFSDEGIPALWSTENCPQTAQWYNHEMSPWRTIVNQFQDQESTRPWQIRAPSDRGYLVPGPENFPRESLGFPHVNISNTGTLIALPIELTVVAHDGEHPVPNAVVVLYKDDGALTVNQGLTLGDGKIDILGAESGDELHIMTLDGALSGRGTVQMNVDMIIPLR